MTKPKGPRVRTRTPRSPSTPKDAKRAPKDAPPSTPMTKAGPIEINPEFRRALDAMENGSGHVFITGKAGTGKSTLLEYFRDTTQKKIAVLAPTGVAALNVRGQTIHSFFKFKIDITPDKIRKIPRGRENIYREFDGLIIDEVSMVRADLMDCIETFLRQNGPRPGRPFGGLQMIFIGDLYQLPPVVASADREVFTHHYESPYFFSSRAFENPAFNMDFIELEKIYRQTDGDFIALLNAIRNRSAGEDDIARLNSLLDPEFEPSDEDFYITLTSTNDQANLRNRARLNALPGRPRIFHGLLEGDFDRGSLPTEEELSLKKGAQVMFVNNDRKGRWVNGTLGRITGLPSPKDEDGAVRVELADGEEVDVTPALWELFAYRYDRESGNIVTDPTGSFIQYPLRLAWAVTIHKSQGKTFDRVVIDVGRGTFAHGQVYVALSRCTSFRGMVLAAPIRRGHIRMDWRVVKFLTRFQYKKADERTSLADRRRTVEDAAASGRELDIVYLKPDDTKTRRRILPLGVEIMEFKGRTFEGLRALCRLRGEERVFRIDRMLEIEPV